MRPRVYGLVILAIVGSLILAACFQSYQNIPPNYIGMKLTPTGYEDTIYTPGQVDIGTTSQSGHACTKKRRPPANRSPAGVPSPKSLRSRLRMLMDQRRTTNDERCCWPG